MKIKNFNPRNPWMKLGNALVTPLLILSIPFVALYVAFEWITNKQDK